MFYIRDSKIASSYVRGFPKVQFHAKFKSKQLKGTRFHTKYQKKKKKVNASSRNPSLNSNTVLIPQKEKSLN